VFRAYGFVLAAKKSIPSKIICVIRLLDSTVLGVS